MPARQLAFKKENILSAWVTAGAIPLNPQRVQKSETREDSKHVLQQGSSHSITIINRVPSAKKLDFASTRI